MDGTAKGRYPLLGWDRCSGYIRREKEGPCQRRLIKETKRQCRGATKEKEPGSPSGGTRAKLQLLLLKVFKWRMSRKGREDNIRRKGKSVPRFLIDGKPRMSERHEGPNFAQIIRQGPRGEPEKKRNAQHRAAAQQAWIKSRRISAENEKITENSVRTAPLPQVEGRIPRHAKKKKRKGGGSKR